MTGPCLLLLTSLAAACALRAHALGHDPILGGVFPEPDAHAGTHSSISSLGSHEATWRGEASVGLADLVPHAPARSLLEGPSKRPLIYAYHLSPRFTIKGKPEAYIPAGPYGLEVVFPHQLRDSPYITDDPAKADYFFAPAHLYHMEDKHNLSMIPDLLAEFRAQGHWLDRKNGSDHILLIVEDHGRCQCDMYRQHLGNIILMEHWGKVTGLYSPIPCKIFDRWGGDCDFAFQWTAARAALTKAEATAAAWPKDYDAKEQLRKKREAFTPCYIKGQDLLVPCTANEGPNSSRYLPHSKYPLTPLTDRPTLVFFAGGYNNTHRSNALMPENDAAYSFGARQTFARMYAGEPGYRVFYDVPPTYLDEMHMSLFCLAPAGWGWGSRFKASITRGCIPIIVQDGLKVEWEDDIDVNRFAIRLPLWYMHRLPELLAKYIKDGVAQDMLTNLQCVWRLYWWHRPHGRAFEMTMCVLRARTLGARPSLDWATCRLFCGDGVPVDFNQPHVPADFNLPHAV